MIIDKIENLHAYANLSKKLKKGIEYINNSDFSKIDLGTYQIDGDNVFAIVQEYNTKQIETCKLEGHQKYIDIQYIVKGEEHIGLALKNNQKITEKNNDNDYAFYKGDSTLFKFNSSVFGIFFPDDLHMPCVGLNQTSTVRKVVVKVLI